MPHVGLDLERDPRLLCCQFHRRMMYKCTAYGSLIDPKKTFLKIMTKLFYREKFTRL